MASSTIKLVYFNLRGRGELIRHILKVADVAFEDERVEFGDWPEVKKTTPSPNGKLPYMDIDGSLYTESLALARFFAQKYGLAGKNKLEVLNADAIVTSIDDIRSNAYLYLLNPVLTAEQKSSVKEKFTTETCPSYYDKFEKILSKSSSGFLVGDSLTIADLALADINDQVKTEIPEFFAKYPNVTKHNQKVKTLPKLENYLATRPDTPL